MPREHCRVATETGEPTKPEILTTRPSKEEFAHPCFRRSAPQNLACVSRSCVLSVSPGVWHTHKRCPTNTRGVNIPAGLITSEEEYIWGLILPAYSGLGKFPESVQIPLHNQDAPENCGRGFHCVVSNVPPPHASDRLTTAERFEGLLSPSPNPFDSPEQVAQMEPQVSPHVGDRKSYCFQGSPNPTVLHCSQVTDHITGFADKHSTHSRKESLKTDAGRPSTCCIFIKIFKGRDLTT